MAVIQSTSTAVRVFELIKKYFFNVQFIRIKCAFMLSENSLLFYSSLPVYILLYNLKQSPIKKIGELISKIQNEDENVSWVYS